MDMNNDFANVKMAKLFTTIDDHYSEATIASFDRHDDNATLHFYGPLRDPLWVVLPITVIYMVIFFTGVIGNISTCIVISRNRSMHTATNYYLFSLAISDFVLLISGVPNEVYSIWYKYPYVLPFNFELFSIMF